MLQEKHDDPSSRVCVCFSFQWLLKSWIWFLFPKKTTKTLLACIFIKTKAKSVLFLYSLLGCIHPNCVIRSNNNIYDHLCQWIIAISNNLLASSNNTLICTHKLRQIVDYTLTQKTQKQHSWMHWKCCCTNLEHRNLEIWQMKQCNLKVVK